MPVFRIHKTNNYTVMSNTHLQDKSLSLKAKGLLSVMLSLPEDWEYSVLGLVALSKDGKDAIMSTIDELSAAGYINITKTRSSDGRFAFEYDIYETPNRESRCGKSESVNPPLYNTKDKVLRTNVEDNNNTRISTTSSPNTSNVIISSTTKKEKEKEKEKKGLDLSFVSIHFQDVFERWLAYHKELGRPYKQMGAEGAYRKLVELSNNDPHTAQEIVEQSISNNWQGLFPLKNNSNNGSNRSNSKEEWARRTLAGLLE